MKILITGGAGFVGQALRRALGNEHTLTILDTAPAPADLGPNTRWIEASILDEAALREAFAGQQAVFHLAAALGVRACQEREDIVEQVNVGGMEAVIAAAIATSSVEHLLFTSSSEIYGDGEPGRIFREQDEPAPRSAYGRSKVAGEKLMAAAAASPEGARLSYTAFRLFNAYGPGQRADFVVPAFCRAALQGEAPVVHGDGQQTRTFTFIEDIAAAMVAALERRAPARAAGSFEVFNLVSEETLTIASLAQLVCLSAGEQPQVIHRDHEDPSVGRSKRFEVTRRVADNGKAREALGFRPATPLSEGVRRTLDDIRTRAASGARA